MRRPDVRLLCEFGIIEAVSAALSFPFNERRARCLRRYLVMIEVNVSYYLTGRGVLIRTLRS